MLGSGGIRVASGSTGDQSPRHPLGHSAFVEAHLSKKAEEQALFLERIPAVPDVQSSWALLLHCAAARANYLLRVVKPEATTSHAQRHNAGLWKCLCEILHVDPESSAELWETASMPLCLGGMGLRDASRVATSAYWASWADSMPMIFQRHPDVATAFVQELEGAPEGCVGSTGESNDVTDRGLWVRTTNMAGFDRGNTPLTSGT